MAAKPLTVKEFLEMTSDDLKQVMIDIGEDPRGMNKTAVQYLSKEEKIRKKKRLGKGLITQYSVCFYRTVTTFINMRTNLKYWL